MRHATLRAFLMELELWPLKPSGEHHYVLRCLYPSKHHGYDHKPSATVSFDLGRSWFTCWSCGTKRRFTQTVMEDGTPGWSLIAVKYRDLEDVELRHAAIERPLRAGPPPIRNCTPGLRTLRKHGMPESMRRFLESKNCDPDFAWRRFCVAFVPAGHADEFMGLDAEGRQREAASDLVFTPTLVRSNDKFACVGGQARPLDGDKKYFTLYPYPARHYLYGEHLRDEAADKPACYVEGQFDVIHLWQEGIPAFGLFGLHMSDPRALKASLIPASSHWLFLDPDSAGARSVEAAAAALSRRGVTVRIVRHDRDPKWCDAETLERLLDFPRNLRTP